MILRARGKEGRKPLTSTDRSEEEGGHECHNTGQFRTHRTLKSHPSPKCHSVDLETPPRGDVGRCLQGSSKILLI